MSEFVIQDIDGQGGAHRHPAHAGIEHRAEKHAGPEAVIFRMLGRYDEIDDGLLVADALQNKRAFGGELHQVLIGERGSLQVGGEIVS